jgi:hypothetical protein
MIYAAEWLASLFFLIYLVALLLGGLLDLMGVGMRASSPDRYFPPVLPYKSVFVAEAEQREAERRRHAKPKIIFVECHYCGKRFALRSRCPRCNAFYRP